MLKKTTEKQSKFLKFVDNFCKENGYSPSVREIAKGLGLSSTSGVQSMIDRLSAKGLLTRESGFARTLSLNTPQNQEGIPVVGRIRAGVPVTAEENIEGYVLVQNFLDTSSGGFFLIVEGDSMKDKGILSGDYVFIKPQKHIFNNQIGAFRLNGEITLKTFIQKQGEMFLMPANDEFTPIKIKPDDDFEVIGKYTMLLRLSERKHERGYI